MSAFGGGGFGQPPPFGSSAFGSSAPTFGASSAFGAQSNSLFGQTRSSFAAFGQSSSFGSSAAFGSSSVFGAQSAPAFGNAFASNSFGSSAFGSAPAFGSSQPSFASSSAFGAGSSLFGSNQPTGFASSASAFAQSQPAWQQSGAAVFGSGSAFGTSTAGSTLFATNASTNSLFASQTAPAFGAASQGTKGVNWQLTLEYETPGVASKYQSISMMQQFRAKSLEELRVEDYAIGNKGAQTTAGVFGSQPQNTAFGAASQPAFGSANAFGNTPALGSTTPFAPSTGSAFGSTAFGQSSSGFGAQTANVFGTNPTSFGTQPSGFGSSGFAPSGGFGANNQQQATAFGQTSAVGSASQPNMFNTSQTGGSLFGNTGSAFGTGSQSTSLFASQPTQFGATPQQPVFGNPNTGNQASSNPSFGFGSSSGLFAQQSGGFNFTSGQNQAVQQQTAFPSIGAPQPQVGGIQGSQPSLPETYQAIAHHHGSTVAPVGANYGTVLHNLQMIKAKVDEQQRILAEQAKQNSNTVQKPNGNSAVVILPSPSLVKVYSSRDSVSRTQGLISQTPFRTRTRGSVARMGELAGYTPKISGTPIREKDSSESADAEGKKLVPVTPMSLKLTPLFTPKQFSITRRKSTPLSEGATPMRSSRMLPLPSAFRESTPSPIRSRSQYSDDMEGTHPSVGTSRRSLTPQAVKKKELHFMKMNGVKTGERDRVNHRRLSTSGEPVSILRKPKRGNDEELKELDEKNYTGRLSNNEDFMWAHTRPSTWSKKQGLDSEEQYMPEKYLPYLSKEGFYIEPSLPELAARDMTELQMVKGFTVGRRGHGKIEWLEPVDVRGLDLDLAVDIQKGEFAVYPERDAGQLDAAARVTLENMFKKKSAETSSEDAELEERYIRKLKSFCHRNGLEFVDYNSETGQWTFDVPNFSQN